MLSTIYVTNLAEFFYACRVKDWKKKKKEEIERSSISIEIVLGEDANRVATRVKVKCSREKLALMLRDSHVHDRRSTSRGERWIPPV